MANSLNPLFHLLLPTLTTILLLLFHTALATELLFNGFNTTDLSHYGNATVSPRTKTLTLTNATHFSIGRSLYPNKIRTKYPSSSIVLPFSTSFIFAMAPVEDNPPGHGIVFLFTPNIGISGASSAQHLGLFNRTNDNLPSNHVLGIEFDVFKNEEFNDPSDNHVGINVNSLTSVVAFEAGYWLDGREIGGVDEYNKFFRKLQLNNGENYQVWIDYADYQINVTMAPVGTKRPIYPLLNVSLNLSSVFEEEMFVGFTAATGQLIQTHNILAWSFSNSNFSFHESLITSGLPSFLLPKGPLFKSKGFIAGITVGAFLFICLCSVLALLLIRRSRRLKREWENMEEWEFEYWPHRISYQIIDAATKGFAEENLIGIGGNGKVYKGLLEGKTEIAVKQIAYDNGEGMRGFLAEISSLGRLKHRSLVGLRGWCKRDKGKFMLVYDYMENGSLDKKLFDCELNEEILSCEERIKILKDVAHAVLYLHEGWESIVLHRDIKSSNVLLDKDMNARLGDFGLARMHGHGQVANTTRVVGTVGYMAPEILHSGRASVETDVFGFGVLILEVMCGQRPIEDGKVPLVDRVWKLMKEGLLNALDEKLKARGGFDEEEVERILHLGLLCAYPNPTARPTMRQVVRVLDGKIENCEADTEERDDVYLLRKIQTKEMWSSFEEYSSSASRPTFDDIRQSLSSSMSLSWSDNIVHGR